MFRYFILSGLLYAFMSQNVKAQLYETSDKIGIGIPATQEKLEIAGNLKFTRNGSKLYFGTNDYLQFTDGTNDWFKFIYDNTEFFRIENFIKENKHLPKRDAGKWHKFRRNAN